MALSRSRFIQIVGALTIALIVFITYLPAYKVQFYNGWWYLIWSATMDPIRFAIQFLDPANITQGYRPVQGLYMYLLYTLFQFNSDGYHLAHNLFHSANAVLVFLIVAKLSKRWRLAFIAGLIYGVLPNYSLAVFWHAVVDPLSSFFYLLTILLWTRYLDSKRTRDYVITYVAFIFALFSKEVAVFLPIFLFLIAWWFYKEKINLRIDLARYLPFVLLYIPYLWLDLQVQSRGEFVGQFGFKIGPHMLTNLVPYLTVLSFPWLTDLPTDSIYLIGMAIIVIIYIAVMVYKKSKPMLFLGFFAVLNIAPLLGFPLDYFNARYLYLSTITSAVVIALIVETLWQRLGARKILALALGVIITCVVIGASARVADAAAGLAEYTRQIRVPFRDISRAHPTFPPDTYVYIVYSPLTNYWDFEGLFFSKYGSAVKVNSTDLGQPANLRAHTNSFVYYFDASGKPVEIQVDPKIATQTTPTLPAALNIPITLYQIELPTNQVKPGQSLIALMTWHTIRPLEKNYTVFAHLLDAQGNVISQSDNEPGNGASHTSQWTPNHAIADAAIISIPNDAPSADNYHLEIGLYDNDTGQRFSFVDNAGNPSDDKITLMPIRVVK